MPAVQGVNPCLESDARPLVAPVRCGAGTDRNGLLWRAPVETINAISSNNAEDRHRTRQRFARTFRSLLPRRRARRSRRSKAPSRASSGPHVIASVHLSLVIEFALNRVAGFIRRGETDSSRPSRSKSLARSRRAGVEPWAQLQLNSQTASHVTKRRARPSPLNDHCVLSLLGAGRDRAIRRARRRVSRGRSQGSSLLLGTSCRSLSHRQSR
jgi:hypothetical protein